MDGVDLAPRGLPPDHIRLVGHHNQQKSGAAQLLQRVRNTRDDVDLGQRQWCIRLAVANERAVDHAVAIEEDRPRHRVDSHLVSATLTSGCETSRCQTTA